MHELTDIIDLCERSASLREGAVLATIVKVVGSHKNQPGSRILITSDGQVAGTISGSCLEKDLRERATRILASGEPALFEYNMSAEDDIVFGLGLGCGGEVSVLMEPLRANSDLSFLNSINRQLQNRSPVATALVFRAEHGADIPVGARFAISAGAIIAGSSSGLQALRGLRVDVEDTLKTQRSCVKSYSVGTSEVEVFIEYHTPSLSLIICGAGAEARALVTFANALSWDVTVFVSRESSVTIERFPDANQVIVCPPGELEQHIQLDNNTAAVILTHDYFIDLVLLRVFLQSPIPYIGLLSSGDRFHRLLHDLRKPPGAPDESCDESQLSRIYSPVGLDIGANTSAEISLSITAEIQAVLAGKKALSLRKKTSAFCPEGNRTGGIAPATTVGDLAPKPNRSEVAALVLAAGGSTRLGGIKQLLPFQNTTLLRHTVTCALQSPCDKVFVALGAHQKLCADELHGLPIEIIDCPNWSDGLSASLRAGIRSIASHKNISAALIMLCDQPLLTSDILERIIESFQESETIIVASEYSGVLGAPALIERSLFPEIDMLRGDSGASGVIKKHRSDTIAIPFPGGSMDIDTSEDYKEMVSGNIFGSH